MRKLVFEMISDSRFEDYQKEGRARCAEVKKKLDLDGITLEYDTLRDIEFGDGTKQLRQKFYVSKNTRKYTWNDIMKLVNSVRAVPYSWK